MPFGGRPLTAMLLFYKAENIPRPVFGFDFQKIESGGQDACVQAVCFLKIPYAGSQYPSSIRDPIDGLQGNGFIGFYMKRAGDRVGVQSASGWIFVKAVGINGGGRWRDRYARMCPEVMRYCLQYSLNCGLGFLGWFWENSPVRKISSRMSRLQWGGSKPRGWPSCKFANCLCHALARRQGLGWVRPKPNRKHCLLCRIRLLSCN